MTDPLSQTNYCNNEQPIWLTGTFKASFVICVYHFFTNHMLISKPILKIQVLEQAVTYNQISERRTTNWYQQRLTLHPPFMDMLQATTVG